MTLGGTYLCPVCHNAFVTIGREHGHLDEKHPEAAQIYAQLENGTDLLHLPGVQTSVSPSRTDDEAFAGV